MQDMTSKPDTIHRILYVSSSREVMSPGEIDDILEVARRKNGANGVTGMLLYHDGNFFQVLEGPHDKVDQTFARIHADPRHGGVIEMLRVDTSTRAFADWSMGYANPSTLDSTQQEALQSLRDLRESVAALTSDPMVGVLVRGFISGFRDL